MSEVGTPVGGETGRAHTDWPDNEDLMQHLSGCQNSSQKGKQLHNNKHVLWGSKEQGHMGHTQVLYFAAFEWAIAKLSLAKLTQAK